MNMKTLRTTLAAILLALALPVFSFAAPIVPKERIVLYEPGGNLSAFTTWLVPGGTEDPLRVFSTVDRLEGAGRHELERGAECVADGQADEGARGAFEAGVPCVHADSSGFGRHSRT